MAKSLFELATWVHKHSRELPAIDLSKRVLAGESVNNAPAKTVNNAKPVNNDGGQDHRAFMRDYMRGYRAKLKAAAQKKSPASKPG